jgi:Auxiliary Activity family 9 (formerly GH61)
MTYMANCGGDCTKVDPTTLSYFKIDEAGLNSDGTWASDDLIANNNTWTVTIPSDIAAGQYIIRHELLALHSAGNVNGAQFYPMCANVEVTGSGTAKPAGVKFPGAYTAQDAGILFNMYNNPKSYVIPGPAVYGSGSGSGSPAPSATSIKASVTSAAPVNTSAPAVTSTAVAAPVSSSVVSSIAPVVPTTRASSATTLVTRTRTATSAAGTPAAPSAPAGGCSKDPVSYNKCLDAVNQCLDKANNGGSTTYEACNAQRASCKMC